MEIRLTEENIKDRKCNILVNDPTGQIMTYGIITPESMLDVDRGDPFEFYKRYRSMTGGREYRDPEYIYHMDDPVGWMKERAESLENDFYYGLGFACLPYAEIRGKNTRLEDWGHSVIILNCSPGDICQLSFSYGQSSYFFAELKEDHSELYFYRTKNNGHKYILQAENDGISSSEEAAAFFRENSFEFEIYMDEIRDNMPALSNREELLIALEPDRNFQSRSIHRRNAYRKRSA